MSWLRRKRPVIQELYEPTEFIPVPPPPEGSRPPGWYTYNTVSGQRRWWDGVEWTRDTIGGK